jgi:ankyrin repeat protein
MCVCVCVCVCACVRVYWQSGLTSLHVVAFMGYMNITLYLLQHGSNPNTTTVRGETALHLAARANQTEILRILLRNGATVDARARVSNSRCLGNFVRYVNSRHTTKIHKTEKN